MPTMSASRRGDLFYVATRARAVAEHIQGAAEQWREPDAEVLERLMLHLRACINNPAMRVRNGELETPDANP